MKLTQQNPSLRAGKKARVPQGIKQAPIPGQAEDDKPIAGPSKRLQEFMDVMKGSDPTKPTEANAVQPTKKPKVEKSDKGKERAEDEVEEAVDDDDAAWLERRRKAALGDVNGATEAAADVSDQASFHWTARAES